MLGDGTAPVAPQQTGLYGHALTWFLSVLSAVIVGAAWVYTHPAPRFAVVDVARLANEEVENLTQRIRPDMSDQERTALINQAGAVGGRIEEALETLGRECRCVILHAGAVVNGRGDIPDMTGRVRELLAAKK